MLSHAVLASSNTIMVLVFRYSNHITLIDSIFHSPIGVMRATGRTTAPIKKMMTPKIVSLSKTDSHDIYEDILDV